MTRSLIVLAVIVYLLWKWMGSSVTAITGKLGVAATATRTPVALSDSPATPQVVKSSVLPAPAPVLISNIMPVSVPKTITEILTTPQVVDFRLLPAPAPVLISNILDTPTIIKGVPIPVTFGTGLPSSMIAGMPIEMQNTILRSLGYRT